MVFIVSHSDAKLPRDGDGCYGHHISVNHMPSSN